MRESTNRWIQGGERDIGYIKMLQRYNPEPLGICLSPTESRRKCIYVFENTSLSEKEERMCLDGPRFNGWRWSNFCAANVDRQDRASYSPFLTDSSRKCIPACTEWHFLLGTRDEKVPRTSDLGSALKYPKLGASPNLGAVLTAIQPKLHCRRRHGDAQNRASHSSFPNR